MLLPKLSLRSLASFPKCSGFFILIALSNISMASEGGFIGAYAGTTVSNSADKTSNSFKLLTGAHITSQLSLEFGYMNLGKTQYNTPKAVNRENTSRDPISFENTSHGSVSLGQLGDSTPVPDSQSLYNNKGDSTFTGVSEFVPQGALVNFSYRFPLVNSLDFFVKTGFYAWWADYKTITVTASQDDGVSTITDKERQTSGVNTISGGGFIYQPMPQLSFRAEIETTAISSGEMPRTRLQNISLGANFEF